MMTQSRGIQMDRGRISIELGSGNEQSRSRLALSHEWVESKRRQRREAESREARKK